MTVKELLALANMIESVAEEVFRFSPSDKYNAAHLITSIRDYAEHQYSAAISFTTEQVTDNTAMYEESDPR